MKQIGRLVERMIYLVRLKVDYNFLWNLRAWLARIAFHQHTYYPTRGTEYHVDFFFIKVEDMTLLIICDYRETESEIDVYYIPRPITKEEAEGILRDQWPEFL